MKFLRSALLSLCLLGCGNATAAIFSDRNFDQDHMIPTNYSIMILSAFEDEDHITAYSDYGSLLWDVAINTKVISWKLKDGLLYVFSKSRYLEKTYLHCIDPTTGRVIWERP
jgi:outer membrane protein assembly factor BamB